ncbi:MAG TPA: response regulator [Rickettsiales bacterium]|nr:response regulator [Rickettsiales bacterium]
MSGNVSDHETHPARILLVEDNAGDAVLVRRMCRKTHLADDIAIANTAEAALSMLQTEARPDFIMLDLSLPQMTGEEFLDEVMNHRRWRDIPVLIFTSEITESKKTLRKHVSGYLAKPANQDGFDKAAKQLEQFWHRFSAGQNNIEKAG